MSTAAKPSGRYRAYVSDVSYYSGKLEAYLRYAGIDHERIEVNTDTRYATPCCPPPAL